jgi:hypothetical protein
MKINLAGARRTVEDLMISTFTITRTTRGRFVNGAYEETTTVLYDGKALISAEGTPNELVLGGSPQRRLYINVMLPLADTEALGIMPLDAGVDDKNNKYIIQGVVSGTYEVATRISAYRDQDVP